MPLPSLIQSSDTFNTWLDATNNVIAHIANTDAYVLVTNATSANLVATGNVYVNGAVHTASLVANANVVLGGTSLGASTPLLSLKLGAGNTNTAALYGTNLSITMTNTVWSGTDVTFGPNAVFQGTVTINAAATLTKNVALATAVLTVTTNSTVNTLSVGATQALTYNLNATVSQVTTNSTVYTTNAANIFFTGTNLTLGPNTVTNGTLTTNNSATFGGNVTFSSNVTFNNAMVLGGPLAFGSSFVETATNLSGTGIAAPLSANANAVIHRVASTDASTGYTGKLIAGIQQANTTQNRQLILFNTGTITLLFQHANTAAGANGVLCPGSTGFEIPPGGTCMLYYDSSVGSGARWRVISAPIAVDANTTVSGYVNTAAQSFAGAKTFNNNVSVLGTATINALSANGGVGTAGQFLTSNGSTVYWSTLTVVDANSTTSGLVNTTAQTFAGNKTFSSNVTFSDTAIIGALSANGGVGTSGQFLTSNGSKTYWSTLTVVDANSSTSGLINTAAQTFAGAKTFNAAVNALSTLGITGAVNALSTLGITGAVNAFSTVGIAGALTVNGSVVVANTVDLNNSSSGRLVLPVGTDKWST